jgi:hypothetical protein
MIIIIMYELHINIQVNSSKEYDSMIGNILYSYYNISYCHCNVEQQ